MVCVGCVFDCEDVFVSEVAVTGVVAAIDVDVVGLPNYLIIGDGRDEE